MSELYEEPLHTEGNIWGGYDREQILKVIEQYQLVTPLKPRKHIYLLALKAIYSSLIQIKNTTYGMR